MNIEQLEYFLIASESESFSAAAKKAFTSRQTITRSIRLFEQELGNVDLFLRGAEGINLTPRGEIVRAKAQKILAEIADLKSTFQSEEGNSTEALVKVSFCDHLLADTRVDIDDLSDFPIELYEIGIRQSCAYLLDGTLDLFFLMTMKREFADFDSRIVARVPMTMLVSEDSDLSSKTSLGMNDLCGHDLVLSDDYAEYYGKFLEVYNQLKLPGSCIRVISSQRLMEQVVKRQDAVSPIPVSYTLPASVTGVTYVPWQNSRFDYYVYALTRKGFTNKIVDEVVDHLRSLIV